MSTETERPIPQVLRVHRYDPRATTSKQKQIIQLTESLKGKKLEDIRRNLVSNNVFESKDFKSPFCEKDGSDVGDDMQFDLYLSLLGISSADDPKMDVYFKTKKLFTKVDPAMQEFIDEKLDLAFQEKPELIRKNPELLVSSFDPKHWKAIQGKLNHAADLTEREWSIITRANCLLSGHHVILDQHNEPRRIERSAYTAFKLRPREFSGYEISSSNPETDESHFDGEKYKFRIPRFRVDDDSSITVVETKDSFEKSLSDSSFSEGSFQVAGAAGIGPVSAGFKAGGGGGSSSKDGKVKKEKKERLVVNYNYPRVTLHWDPVCLEVTQECLDDIRTVRNPQTLTAFYQKYGVLFARRVQLGGRLSSSKSKTAKDDAKAAEEAHKFKAAAAASVTSSFAQGSVSYSHESQKAKSKEDREQSLVNSIAWEATGGDTLLCNNPSRWCATVGLYANWRVVNQDEAMFLYVFLSFFSQVGPEISERFTESAQDKFTPELEKKHDEIREDRLAKEEERLKKGPRQIFALREAKSGCYLGVENDNNDLADYFEDNYEPQRYAEVRHVVDCLRDAKASVKCNAKVLNIDTEFLASSPFGPKEKHALKFGQRFQVQSLGHLHREWLNVTPTTPQLVKAGAHRCVWLTGAPGSLVSLQDAKNPKNDGFIEDGSSVYVVVDDLTLVENIAEGLLVLASWDPANPHGVEPLKFAYKAQRIVGSS